MKARPDRDGERGQALAELAIVVTIIMILAIAVFDLSLGFYNSALVVQGARDGARVAMNCSSTVGQIQSAALATAPSGASVTVAPDPRPTCPPSNSSDTATTVTVSYTHSWILPIWTAGGSQAMAEAAVSR